MHRHQVGRMNVCIEEAIPKPRSPERAMSYVISGNDNFPESSMGPPSPRSPAVVLETLLQDRTPDSLTSLLESLQSELRDVVVDLHRTKTKLAALERESEITKTVVSKKIEIGDAFKKQVELITDTVKNLSLPGRYGRRRVDMASSPSDSLETPVIKPALEMAAATDEVFYSVPDSVEEANQVPATAVDDPDSDDIAFFTAPTIADKGKSVVGKCISEPQ